MKSILQCNKHIPTISTYRCGLANVYMDYSSYKVQSKSGLRLVKNVEYCTCPPQFKGQFCQQCNHGYTITPTVYGTVTCSPCQCHGHSKMCNPNTGTCLDCKHKTQGETPIYASSPLFSISKMVVKKETDIFLVGVLIKFCLLPK